MLLSWKGKWRGQQLALRVQESKRKVLLKFECTQMNCVDERTRGAVYVERNIEARSCNHCCSGKAMSVTYYECVSIALGIQHVFYEITNRCSYMQSILFHCYFHSTCFGCFTHPSSGVQFLTVSTATDTNHSIASATYSQRGLRPRWE